MSLDLLALLSCSSRDTVLFAAASIVFLIISCGFHSRDVSIQENTVFII